MDSPVSGLSAIRVLFLTATGLCGVVVLSQSLWASTYQCSTDPRGESAEHMARWKDVLSVQSRRLSYLRDQCLALRLQTSISHLRQEAIELGDFLVDDFRHVILKAVEKTGCTSWRSLVIRSIPVRGPVVEPFQYKRFPEVGAGVLSDSVLRVALYKLEHYFTILTVRHPLKRLESFFTGNYLESRISQNTTPSHTQIMEHFEIFVNSLLNKDKNNHHWDSIYNRSFPCTVNYKYIAKTETAASDMEYISEVILKSNVTGKQRNQSRQIRKDTEGGAGGQLLALFSDLTNAREVIQNLTERYQVDMKLFGYNVSYIDGKYYAVCSEHGEIIPC